MILSDRDIQRALSSKKIVIDPLPDLIQYSPSAVDLRLGNEPPKIWNPDLVKQSGVTQVVNLDTIKFKQLANAFLKPLERQADGSYVVPPNVLVLGTTLENVVLPVKSRLAARVEGRSTMARLGLTAHVTAPTIHCGWSGNIAVEMINVGPFEIRLIPGKTRICQLIIERVSSLPRGELKSAFRGQRSASGSR